MNEACAILQDHWPSPARYGELVAQARTSERFLLRMVPGQSVAEVYDVVLKALAQFPKVVLFGVDAVPWLVLKQNESIFSALVPLTSTVPTSSAAVWSTILRGEPPWRHGIHGVVFYDRTLEASVSVLSNSLFDLDGSERRQNRLDIFLDSGDGIFAEADRQYGSSCHFFGLLGLNSEATLPKSLASGSSWYVGENYQALLQSPQHLLWTYAPLVTAAVEARSKSTFVFCFLDLDTYFHEHPYSDPIIRTFLTELAEFAHMLATRHGAACFLISDHGMARQRAKPGSRSLGRDEWIWKRSYGRPGGAGRIQFFYPKPSSIGDIRSRLIDLVGTSGIVLSRDEYVARFVAPPGTAVRGTERIGELVAIATQPDFPSVMHSSLQEHGSFTEDEMMVGMAAFA